MEKIKSGGYTLTNSGEFFIVITSESWNGVGAGGFVDRIIDII